MQNEMKRLIIEALREDVSFGDITTNNIVSVDAKATVELIAKEHGILSGKEVFKEVFDILGDVEVIFNIEEGMKFRKSDVIANISGNARNILTGERTALNFLQRMCGIATYTNMFVEKIKGSKIKIVDTRKTTPNMRIFEKYSVKVGGGFNHRFNLSDGVLIKDNHIDAAGGIKKAVDLVKYNVPFVRKIEVEVENIEMVKEAVDSAVDIIMLDNMTLEEMKEAIKIIKGRTLVECSGNIDITSIENLADIGIDYVSIGALTHSCKVIDMSMKNLKIY